MDRLIKRFDCVNDDGLRICKQRGVAYQDDMSMPVAYDAAYFEHYCAFAGTPIECALNAGRLALVARYAHAGAKVLDVGVGSGAFVRAVNDAGLDLAAKGYDINPRGVEWLREAGLYADDPGQFEVVTFWDSLEHMEEPESMLGRVAKGALVFVAIPIFEDLSRIRESRHHKPREHFYYFTARGFIDWMALYGFRLLEQSTHETDAGRESIGAFAFCRDLPDYLDHVEAYKELHCTRHYGSSATELHLIEIAGIVRALKPHSILDFGCGRSDLVAHFWLDGARKIERYDPAIPAIKRMPPNQFDLVFVCDVMEHIPMADVEKILLQVLSKSTAALFTISTKLARAKLPDGRNAHVTLLTQSEWARWIKDVFGKVETMDSTSEHELVLLAGAKAIALRRAA